MTTKTLTERIAEAEALLAELKAKKENTMNTTELMQYLGTDARKWGEEFCKYTGFNDLDVAVGWFANAIMAVQDNGRPVCGDQLETMLKGETP
jgi:hypothetical protein